MMGAWRSVSRSASTSLVRRRVSVAREGLVHALTCRLLPELPDLVRIVGHDGARDGQPNAAGDRELKRLAGGAGLRGGIVDDGYARGIQRPAKQRLRLADAKLARAIVRDRLCDMRGQWPAPPHAAHVIERKVEVRGANVELGSVATEPQGDPIDGWAALSKIRARASCRAAAAATVCA